MQNRLKDLNKASPNSVAKKIPQNVRNNAFSFLSLRELFGSVNRVCVGFYKDTQQDSLLRDLYRRTFQAEPLSGQMHPQVTAAFLYERARRAKCEDNTAAKNYFFTSLSEVLNQHVNAPWTHFYWGVLYLQDDFPGIEPNILTSCQRLHVSLAAGEYRAAQVFYQLEIERNEREAVEAEGDEPEEKMPELKIDLVPPLKKLLKLGDDTTLLQLGDIYRSGIGATAQDEKKAEEYLLRSVNEAKDSSAAILVADLYFKTSLADATAEDFAKGINFLTSTAEQLESPSLSLQAGQYYTDRVREWALQNDLQKVHSYFREARRWFLYAYNLGNAEAAKEVGSLYVRGQGVAVNYVKAQKWFERSCNMGCGNAVLHLVDLMELNEIPGGVEEITELLKRGARLGSSLVMYRLYSSFIAEYDWENDPTIVCWVIKIAMECLIPVDLNLVHRASFAVAMLPQFYDEANQIQISMKELMMYRETANAENLLDDQFKDRLDQLQDKAKEAKYSVKLR